MPFNNIGDFLKRFRDITPTDAHIKNALIELIKERFDVDVSKEDIKVQHKTVFLHIHPTTKVNIFLEKKALLQELNTKLGKDEVENIV